MILNRRTDLKPVSSQRQLILTASCFVRCTAYGVRDTEYADQNTI